MVWSADGASRTAAPPAVFAPTTRIQDGLAAEPPTPYPFPLVEYPNTPPASFNFNSKSEASTNSDGCFPAKVSASCALIAYGTLTNKIRGSSCDPPRRTVNQRASPDVNKSTGRPVG